MKWTMLVVIMAVLLLVGCSSKAPEDQFVAPVVVTEEPATTETTEDVDDATTDIVETGTDKAFGEVDKETALDINSVRCDKATRTITFRFKNDAQKKWQLDQPVPFPAPKDLEQVFIHINSYEVNSRNGYIKDGERYFGPSEKFSENCGGVTVMEPGTDVTCTLSPVPLKEANQLITGNNEIFIKTSTSKNIIQFMCE